MKIPVEQKVLSVTVGVCLLILTKFLIIGALQFIYVYFVIFRTPPNKLTTVQDGVLNQIITILMSLLIYALYILIGFTIGKIVKKERILYAGITGGIWALISLGFFLSFLLNPHSIPLRGNPAILAQINTVLQVLKNAFIVILLLVIGAFISGKNSKKVSMR